MNIMQVGTPGICSPEFERTRYYIDCPIDIYPHDIGGPDQECRRIEIPRELARYIDTLQRTITRLEDQLKESAPID